MQTRHTQIWLLMLVAMLLVSPLASARLAVAWVCEGRICNTTNWSCCCDAGSGRETNCAVTSAKPAGGDQVCAAGCGCTQLITASTDPEPATRAKIAVSWTPVLADIPTVTLSPMPPQAAVVKVAYPIAGRAPPVYTGNLASPSLRAPPASPMFCTIA